MNDELASKIVAELARIANYLDQIRDALVAINAREAKKEVPPLHRY
jgi:hypothetical protein